MSEQITAELVDVKRKLISYLVDSRLITYYLIEFYKKAILGEIFFPNESIRVMISSIRNCDTLICCIAWFNILRLHDELGNKNNLSQFCQNLRYQMIGALVRLMYVSPCLLSCDCMEWLTSMGHTTMGIQLFVAELTYAEENLI